MQEINTKDPFVFNFSKAGSAQRVVVNWPTDEQWITRARAGRSVMRTLGGGKTMSLPASEEALEKADLDLFRAILVEPKGDVDEEFAMRLVEILDRGSIASIEPAGDLFVIGLKVLGAQGYPAVLTKHTLRAPTFREERKWRNRYSQLVSHQGSKYEIRTNPELAGEMYDELTQKAEGYSEGSRVPIHHKVAVVGRLMAMVLSDEDQEVEDEDHF